jgi:hypothetical protein
VAADSTGSTATDVACSTQCPDVDLARPRMSGSCNPPDVITSLAGRMAVMTLWDRPADFIASCVLDRSHRNRTKPKLAGSLDPDSPWARTLSLPHYKTGHHLGEPRHRITGAASCVCDERETHRRMKISFVAWVCVPWHGRDLADRLARGFTAYSRRRRSSQGLPTITANTEKEGRPAMVVPHWRCDVKHKACPEIFVEFPGVKLGSSWCELALWSGKIPRQRPVRAKIPPHAVDWRCSCPTAGIKLFSKLTFDLAAHSIQPGSIWGVEALDHLHSGEAPSYLARASLPGLWEVEDGP